MKSELYCRLAEVNDDLRYSRGLPGRRAERLREKLQDEKERLQSELRSLGEILP